MATEYNSAEYGDKKRLADLGLGRKETYEGSGTPGLVNTPATGRPTVSPLAAPVPDAESFAQPEELYPDEAADALMTSQAEADSAWEDAQRYVDLPDAGSWVQWYLALARELRDREGHALNQGTPDWQM